MTSQVEQVPTAPKHRTRKGQTVGRDFTGAGFVDRGIRGTSEESDMRCKPCNCPGEFPQSHLPPRSIALQLLSTKALYWGTPLGVQ